MNRTNLSSPFHNHYQRVRVRWLGSRTKLLPRKIDPVSGKPPKARWLTTAKTSLDLSDCYSLISFRNFVFLSCSPFLYHDWCPRHILQSPNIPLLMRHSEKFLVIVFVYKARLEEFIIPNSFPTRQSGINFLFTGVEHTKSPYRRATCGYTIVRPSAPVREGNKMERNFLFKLVKYLSTCNKKFYLVLIFQGNRD